MANTSNLFIRSILPGIIAASATFAGLAQDSAPLLEEIIVTAEKRSESLQDLSQAVTALSGEDMDNRNIITFVDLGSIAPGVTAAKNEGYKTVIAIRGVGNEANQNAIANPSVSYHLDGIYVASPFALHTDFLDLERIEVLRGPQGTLFGQNSTGGAINVITKAPDTEEFFGKADITVGNYSLVRARGSVNIPISDTMALRASAASHNHDGFSRNITLDQELDQADSFSGRARLLWAPTENLRFNFTAQYYDENTNGAAQKGILDSTPDPRRLAQDRPSSYELESQLYSLVAEWDLPAFTVRSLTSYQDDDVTVVRDNDRHDFSTLVNRGTFLLPASVDPETDRQKTFTQEINLISSEPLFGRLDWVAGVFYLDTEVDILFREYIDFNTDGVYGPDTVTVEEVLKFGGEVGFISDSKPERESISVYGQGTWNLTDSLRLVAGLRYTEDEVYSEVTNFFGRAGTAILETRSEKLTGRGVVEFDLNDTTMVYASYTRGFKPGGSNLTYGREDIVAPIVVLPTYADETVEAWEAGHQDRLCRQPGARECRRVLLRLQEPAIPGDGPRGVRGRGRQPARVGNLRRRDGTAGFRHRKPDPGCAPGLAGNGDLRITPRAGQRALRRRHQRAAAPVRFQHILRRHPARPRRRGNGRGGQRTGQDAQLHRGRDAALPGPAGRLGRFRGQRAIHLPGRLPAPHLQQPEDR